MNQSSKQAISNQKAAMIYYQKLCELLKQQPLSIPRMLLDLDRIDQNVNAVKDQVQGKQAIRLVIKSLPSYPLLNYLTKAFDTNGLMIFHHSFLKQIINNANSKTDILFGKPMPIKNASEFYRQFKSTRDFNPFTQINWLIDDQNRLKQYLSLAKSLGKCLHLNLELNVGLHRGGFQANQTLEDALQLIANNSKYLSFTGFMGYDPHITKLPKWLTSSEAALNKSQALYANCIQLLKTKFPSLHHSDLCFNGAGSPSFHLHQTKNSPINEISIGSCLVKPLHFDLPSLAKFKPACFIGSPILKKRKGGMLPGLENYKRLLKLIHKKERYSYFIYGGNWNADFVYPTKITNNKMFGPSSNQSMINSNHGALEIDDFVLLRPHQSEAVFLQFGSILAFRKEQIIEWPILCN